MCWPDCMLLLAGLGIGLGLHRTTWAALSSIGSSRDSTKGLTGTSCWQDLVGRLGPGRLAFYAFGTSTSADPPGIFLPAHQGDGSPGKVICHSTRLATRPFGVAGLRSSSVRWRTQKRTIAGGPTSDQAEQWTHDASLQRVVQMLPFESVGL